MSFNGYSNEFPLNVRTTPMQADLYNVYAEEGTPPSPPGINHWIQNPSNDFWLQQNGDQWIINN